MNNFEIKAIGEILTKIIPTLDMNVYEFDELIELITKEYKIKKSEIPSLKVTRNGRIGFKEKKIYLNNFSRIINKRIKTIPNEDCVFKNQLELIKDICSLNSIHYNVLLFYGLTMNTKIGEVLYDCMENPTFDTFCKTYFKLDSFNTRQLRKELTELGIIDDGNGRHEICLNAQIIDIITNKKINSYEKVKRILVGNYEKAELKWSDFEHYKTERETVLNILKSAVENKTKGINILLYGDVGTGKTQFAKMIANKAGINEYQVLFEKKNKEEALYNERIMDLYAKQNILKKLDNSCILFDEAEDVFNGHYCSKAYINNILDNTPVPVFWTTNDIYHVDPAILRRMTYSIEFEKLTEENRLNIWRKILKKNDFAVDENKLLQLNKAYDISPSVIENAIKTSKLIGGNEDSFELFVENIAKVVLKKRSVKKKKEFEMKEYDINLINTDLNMNDLTEKIKKCGKLNFSLCMYGEPGTGKSLYARFLAKELGIDVIQKRASDLISMWVGKTEQNIAEAFAEAKAKKAMLIFDEADSFLQNRGNASHNWEVSQVNEMLTWMESHEYPFVCTTNLLDTLDEASLRRFTFKIKFDFMNKEQVNQAVEHFFGIQDAELNINGLTAGDFATVKKKADFLNITDINELSKMLHDEVKLKNAKSLKNVIGF